LPFSASTSSATSKRGFNDVADLCVAYNCAGRMPGSFDYIKCIRHFRCM
jgi:hypothetical protein